MGAEVVAAACKYLVAVGLMANVPYYFVVRRVINVVQRHCQLHGSEARSQMAGIDRQFIKDVLSQFVAHLRQLVHCQFAQIFRSINVAQKAQSVVFHNLII